MADAAHSEPARPRSGTSSPSISERREPAGTPSSSPSPPTWICVLQSFPRHPGSGRGRACIAPTPRPGHRRTRPVLGFNLRLPPRRDPPLPTGHASVRTSAAKSRWGDMNSWRSGQWFWKDPSISGVGMGIPKFSEFESRFSAIDLRHGSKDACQRA